MRRSSVIYGMAIGAAVFGLVPLAARADGPCTSDIAQLGRQLGNSAGLGAPVSEPSAGLVVGQKTTQMQPIAAGTNASDRAQPGGASLAAGGSPGTVGGVAGPVGAATGSQEKNAVATGQIATSAEDVRRQSEGKPTMAQQAATPGNASAGNTSASDRVSQAKMALQRAVDLNAKGDKACMTAITQARGLMPKQ